MTDSSYLFYSNYNYTTLIIKFLSLYHFTHVFQRIQSDVTLRHKLILNGECNHYLHRLRNHATVDIINPLKSNDPYRGRTAPPTSKRWILYI